MTVEQIKKLHPAFKELFEIPVDIDFEYWLMEWCRKWIREDKLRGFLVDKEG